MKTKPRPFKWRYRNCGCELHKGWTYKRNYRATTYDIDGDRYRYLIHEMSDKDNPQLVIVIDDFDFSYDIHERCEYLLRTLAKGKTLTLNAKEIELLKNGYNCEYHPENIKFEPYADKKIINER